MMMAVAIEFFKLHYLLSQVIATGVILIWTFLGNRLWTFKEAGHGTKS
jgi:putative flippase GtrA